MMLPVVARLLRERLRRRALRQELQHFAHKLLRRGSSHRDRVVTLPAAGVERGRALLSFILDPYLLPPDEEPSHRHSHDWESREMGRTLAELGFTVDAVHWSSPALPRHDYTVVVDVRLNLERWAPALPGAFKLLHAETCHWRANNAAQERRHAELAARRGIVLPANRLIEENRAAEAADAIVYLGNDATAETYAFAGKAMHRLPVSVPCTYPFPVDKDFAAVAHRFLWFGSSGLVHKGLDLVLEAFRGLPDHHLTVCGPVRREAAFERAFCRELYETPNIETLGWVDVANGELEVIASRCLGLVYPSCAEGGGASALTCMHAGLVPVLTRQASVDLPPGCGIELPEASVETIRQAVLELSGQPPDRLAALAREAWQQARRQHTREAFARNVRAVYRELLGARGLLG